MARCHAHASLGMAPRHPSYRRFDSHGLLVDVTYRQPTRGAPPPHSTHH
jgi:hypothetical protein